MAKRKLDPYRELELDRDATTEEVKRAYLRRAMKTHPDVGGTSEAFIKTKRALAILSNPQKRQRYDATGDVEEEQPDNTRSAALQIIEAFMNEVIGQFLGGKAPGVADPRVRDLRAEFFAKMDAEINAAEASWIEGGNVLAFLQDMRRRFKTVDKADPIGRGFELRINGVNSTRADLRLGIDARREAMKIVRGYDFEQDWAGGGYGISVTVYR